ncbi:MAG: ZIP family metal transporter [bacterium]
MIYLIGILAVISTLLGGLFALKLKDKLHLILGFSAGAVVAVALFDLIPESIELVSAKYNTQTVMLFIAIGFCVFMIFDRFFSIHPHSKEHCANPHHHTDRFGVVALAIHSLIDGLGVGLAFKVSPEVGIIVAVAVLAHKFTDGINTVSMTLKDEREREDTILWLSINALAPMIGIISSLFFNISQTNLGLTLSIFAGLFLYLGASELIPESHHRHPTFWTSLMTVLGMVTLYLIIQIAG